MLIMRIPKSVALIDVLIRNMLETSHRFNFGFEFAIATFDLEILIGVSRYSAQWITPLLRHAI